MDRVADLRADYEMLGKQLFAAEGSGAAAIARERRLIGELLERLEKRDGETPLVDELAERRTEAGDDRPAARRRKSR